MLRTSTLLVSLLVCLLFAAPAASQPLPRPPGTLANASQVSVSTNVMTNCNSSTEDNVQECLEAIDARIEAVSVGGGSSIILDLADDDINESTAIAEIATSASNSIFSEPSANKWYIDLSQPWPTASALAANGANCSSGSFPLGVDASGAAESCTDAATQTELNAWKSLNGTGADIQEDGSGKFYIDEDEDGVLDTGEVVLNNVLPKNVLFDFDADGNPDYVIVGDYDGDGTLELLDDINAAVAALTDTGPKYVRIEPGIYSPPAATACDAGGEPCYDQLSVSMSPGSGFRGFIQLPSNITVECSGSRSTRLDTWAYTASPSTITGSPVIDIKDADNVEVKNCGIRGGGSASYSSVTSGIGWRGFQIYNSTNVRISGNYCEWTHHACYFAESVENVVFSGNTAYSDGGVNDTDVNRQASFYVYQTPTSAPRETNNVEFSGNVSIDGGGNAFNLRREASTTYGMSNIVVQSNVVHGTYACARIRGQSRFVVQDLVCNETAGVVIDGGSAYREAADPDVNVGGVIDGLTLNSTVLQASGSAAILIEDYNEGLSLRNIAVTQVTEVGGGGSWCMEIQAPGRHITVDGFKGRRCGTAGGGIKLSDADGWDGDFEYLTIANVDLEDVDVTSDISDGVSDGILFGSGNFVDSTIRGLRIAGVSNKAISIASGVTWTRSTLTDARIDMLAPRYLGRFTVAGLPTCNAARTEFWTTISDDASGGTACNSGGGGGVNHCQCNGIAWVEKTSNGQNAIDIDSAVGITYSTMENVHISNVEAGDGIAFEGAGTSDHTGNRLEGIVCSQTSTGIVFQSAKCVEFNTNVGTSNWVESILCPTANPSTCLEVNSGSTFAEWTSNPDNATQAELDAKSAASSTDHAVARFDSTAGDIQDSGVIVDDSGNLDAPGSINGLARIVSYSSSQTLTAQDMRCSVITNDGATGLVTLGLPEASQGACVTVQLAEAQDVNVDPQGASGCTPLGAGCDQIIGATSSGGEYLSSDSLVGSSLSVVGLNANEWMVIGQAGTWTEETP